MSIYIDSAKLDEIEEAIGLGYVRGVTTNPLLMAKTDGAWRDTLKRVCDLITGPVYYQIDENDETKFVECAKSIFRVSPNQIILKLPAVPQYFRLASQIGAGMPCCMTAVYSESQLYAAAESGAKHIAVYVNRMTKFFKQKRVGVWGDGPQIVSSMRNLIEKCGMKIELLAASLKSVDELMMAMKAGAHHVTTTLDVLKVLSQNELSYEACEEFKKACDNDVLE